jgi:hypothetical protein
MSPRTLVVMGHHSLVDPIFEKLSFPLGLDRLAANQSGMAHEV